MSRRRRCTVLLFWNEHWASPGYWRRHVSKEKCGTREARLGSPRRAKTGRIRRKPSFPLEARAKRVARAPPAAGVLAQRAALDEFQDVTVGRVLRGLGELGVF